MKPVAKYNTCKGVSTALTVGTPIITLCSCSEFFIHRSETAISAAGIFVILLTLLFFKDKIVENFKMPSAFVVSLVVFLAVLIAESIITPLKYVSLSTLCACSVDELTFKRWYKNVQNLLPEDVKSYKFAGFVFTTSENLLGGQNE